jgi:hypothetical protein
MLHLRSMRRVGFLNSVVNQPPDYFDAGRLNAAAMPRGKALHCGWTIVRHFKKR